MADETREQEEGIEPVGSQSPELDDQVLEDVAGGAGGVVQNPDGDTYNNKVYNNNPS